MKSTSVLFVCLGNICRSPTAHGVFEALVQSKGLADRITVDSAATSNLHVGNPPDPRSIATALERGVDLSDQRARQVNTADFYEFDYVLAMDAQNLSDLRAIEPRGASAHVALFLDFAPHSSENEVPDPYYGGKAGFAKVVDLVEQASEGLLTHIQQKDWA